MTSLPAFVSGRTERRSFVSPRLPTRKTRSLQGSVLVSVLVCLAVATTISVGAVQWSLRQRRHLQIQWQVEQTRWLADAGISRGIQKFRTQPGFTGCQWDASEAFSADLSALVEISILPASESSRQRKTLVTATARITRPGQPAIQRSRQIMLDLPDPTTTHPSPPDAPEKIEVSQ